MNALELLVVAGGGLVAGAVNALAGGGSLISFPVLVAAGLPTLSANVTNHIAIWPGYLSAAGTLRRDRGETKVVGRRMQLLAVVGAVVGSVALLTTTDEVFEEIVPWLLFGACGLLAAQPSLQRRLHERARPGRSMDVLLYGGVMVASIYGAYFGGGLGVILLAVLGVSLADPFHRINAHKTQLQLLINTVALVLLGFAGPVHWTAVAVMAPASLLGGWSGAKFSRRVPARMLRLIVIGLGTIVGIVFLVR